MKITTLIIDDEILARQRLINLINDVPEFDLIGECSNGKEAIKMIDELEPNVIFLDIRMKDMTGFNVLEKIESNKRPLIVFVTAYDEFALEAFNFFVFDYLLKPYKDDRFFKSVKNILNYSYNNDNIFFDRKIDNLLSSLKEGSLNVKKQFTEKLPIKLGNKIFFIDTNEIKYVVASGYYAELFTNEKKYVMRISLNNLMNSLNPLKFIRIHRSTIINYDEISELISSNFGEIDVKMKDKKLFRISKSYKKKFLNEMGL